MAVTTRGYIRETIADILTVANTTTEVLPTGIAFVEGTTVNRSTTPRGCYVLASESREASGISEDFGDRAGEADIAVRAEKVIASGENLYDVADAMMDAIERAFESAALPDPFAHPETGVTVQIEGYDLGLFTPAHFNGTDGKQVACVVVYPVVRYERVTP